MQPTSPQDADRIRSGAAPTTAEPSTPSFSEQMAQQLGGVRGLIESTIPVTIFVIVNFLGDTFDWWQLRTSLIIAVAVALAMAAYRLSRRESPRHAFNGVFGIAFGAWIAWRSGEARDFYAPGIVISAAYAMGMLVSVAVRQPLVGWVWSVMVDKGSSRWRANPRLVRAFSWLTVLWAAVFLAKADVQAVLYVMDQADLLGVARIALGWPPYLLLGAVTVWQVRKVTHDKRVTGEPGVPEPGTASP
jgi:hypothetical protein